LQNWLSSFPGAKGNSEIHWRAIFWQLSLRAYIIVDLRSNMGLKWISGSRIIADGF
jgi:hypothetical protein